ADLERKTPYNTYVIFGLPPGPICNPGRAALEAVLKPADSPDLYFVSRNDGTHYFSTTLKEHNRAVFKYQKQDRPGGAPDNGFR
ncbi:MAG TPA: aminodeoxychorismate lyase, partial [Desulfobacteraceae bacterium]|nr:aminodeoxychorismate lyase [Desulfobacteraceae bacterium]